MRQILYRQLSRTQEGLIPFKPSPFLFQKVGFKYHHSRYSSSLYCIKPTIRIGTLSSYRTIEKSSLRDHKEGITETFIGNNVRSDQIHEKNALFSAFCFPKGARFKVENTTIFEEYDFYVFCFSYIISSESYLSFTDDEPYDAVATILDLFRLAEVITAFHPVLTGWFWECLPVTYCKKRRFHGEAAPEPLDVAFEKDLKFEPNFEGRIVFVRPNLSTDRKLIPLPNWSHSALSGLFVPGTIPLS